MKVETLARWEGRLRPLLTRLPPALAVRLYARGRRAFLRAFFASRPAQPWEPQGSERTLWGIRFRAPIFNAAGVFKDGEGYELTALQGAGAYLAGTTTAQPRAGNRKGGVAHPFVPYPTSGAASNWLGLPNPGHEEVARRLRDLPRHEGCPVGVSVALSPEAERPVDERLVELAAAMHRYAEAGVDFIELNESCPNTVEGMVGTSELDERLAFICDDFLDRRPREVPVIVKLSCDTEPAYLPAILDLLFRLNYDGVNFGNSSTAYVRHRKAIVAEERPLFEHFTSTYGGGITGRPLKPLSLALAEAAVAYLGKNPPGQEFHVIRTGGIETAADLAVSHTAGVALSQWYTGYFEAFARHGHQLYHHLYQALESASVPRDSLPH